jgi:hypothetical protein
MPAHSDIYPWPSAYGNFNFFENKMHGHSKIVSIVKHQIGFYEIVLLGGRIIRAFVCECYSFGVAEYEETAEKLNGIDVVIINSSWCGYTDEVKLYCRSKEVGIFNIGAFMAALNTPKFWLYLDEYEKERFEKQGLC